MHTATSPCVGENLKPNKENDDNSNTNTNNDKITSGDDYHRPSGCASADAIPIYSEIDDQYHVFHLGTPPGTLHHPPRLRSSWQHMYSKNLVDWKRSSVSAIPPGSPGSFDADGAWTGNVIEDVSTKTFHAFYTGYDLSKDGKQVIIHATCKRGNDDDKSAAATVPPVFIKDDKEIQMVGDRSAFEDIDFRDAFAFQLPQEARINNSQARYGMLVATRLRKGPNETRGCVVLLTSNDLSNGQWNISPDPFFHAGDIFCPECPEIYKLGDLWYLVYSRFHAPNPGTVYYVSENWNGPWTFGGRFDARRWYAAKSAAGPVQDSRVYFGWVGDQDGQGKWCWGGHMAAPRIITPRKNAKGVLDVLPFAPFIKKSYPLVDVDSKILECAPNQAMKFEPLIKHTPRKQPYYYTSLKITSNPDNNSFGLGLRLDGNRSGYLLRFQSVSREYPSICNITFESFPPPLDNFWADQYDTHRPLLVDGPELIRHDGVKLYENQNGSFETRITLVISDDVLEIFTNGKALTYRLNRPANVSFVDELSLFVQQGSVLVEPYTL